VNTRVLTRGCGAESRAEIWDAILAARQADPECTTAQVTSAYRQAKQLRELSWFYSVTRLGDP